MSPFAPPRSKARIVTRLRWLSLVGVLGMVLLAGGASGEEKSGVLRVIHAQKPGADLSEFRMILDLEPSAQAPRRRADPSELRMSLGAASMPRAPYPRVDLSEFRMSLDVAPISPRSGHGVDLGEFRTTF
ncbi:MAG TPA: hypothetical protein VGM06_00020 [Polyangiaceae bacterium]